MALTYLTDEETTFNFSRRYHGEDSDPSASEKEKYCKKSQGIVAFGKSKLTLHVLE